MSILTENQPVPIRNFSLVNGPTDPCGVCKVKGVASFTAGEKKKPRENPISNTKMMNFLKHSDFLKCKKTW